MYSKKISLKSKFIGCIFGLLIFTMAGLVETKAQSLSQILHCADQAAFHESVLTIFFGPGYAFEFASALQRQCLNDAITFNQTASLRTQPYFCEPIKDEKYYLESLPKAT